MKKTGLLILVSIIQFSLSAQQLLHIGGFKETPMYFDGYTTEKEIAVDIPENGDFTIECWIAPVEYSFNISAIINRQQNFQRGFLLGINHVGQLVGSIAATNQWHTCLSSETVPLITWSHVAFTYTKGTGMKLYINGKLSGEVAFSGTPDLYPEGIIILGKTQGKMSPAYTERKTSTMEKTWMRYNGLIGELVISGKSLSDKEIQNNANKPRKIGVKVINYPQLPGKDIGMGSFGAFYTRLTYTPGWESLWRVGDEADVVVRFPDKPIKYIFWRGTGYIPAIVTENNIWMTDQSVENFSTGECFETMGDKQCRYSHVRILESTPARCLIHWRYALASINHEIYAEDDNGWGDWVDEYWTIYPDGVAIRKQVLHSSSYVKSPKGYQFQETIFFNQPGTRPQDNIEMDAITFSDMEGNVSTYNWEKGPPKKFDKGKYQPIQLVNLKSHYKPFSIFHPERFTKPFSFGWVEGYSTFPCWNHWPVSQIKSDGRNAPAPDRPSHSSLAETTGSMQIVEYGTNNTAIARQMLGMTTQAVETLLPLARSWNNAPKVTVDRDGFIFNGYDIYQRIYRFEPTDGDAKPLSFTIHASKESPVQNIALEIIGWNRGNATVTLNGEELLNGKDYFTGYIQTIDGDKMIIWIYHVAIEDVKIKIN